MKKSDKHFAKYAGHRIRLVEFNGGNHFEDQDWHRTASGPMGDQCSKSLPVSMLAGKWNLVPIKKKVNFTEALAHMKGGRLAEHRGILYTRDRCDNLVANAGNTIARYNANVTGLMIEGEWEIHYCG
jgi:hypothetical protein